MATKRRRGVARKTPRPSSRSSTSPAPVASWDVELRVARQARDHAAELELAAVARARSEGRSWAEIGVYLSLTGEGLRRRHAAAVTARLGSTPAAKRGRRPSRTDTATT